MPYIKRELRAGYDPTTEITPSHAGPLNFQVTRLVDDYLKVNGLSYRTLNEAVGALECAKLELYRRLAAPYEDTKIRENGDVYSAVRT